LLEYRIALLAHNLRSAGGLSVGRSIVATLPKIAPMHRYLIVVPAGGEYDGIAVGDKVEVRECRQRSLAARTLWELTAMRRMIREFQPDWVWALGNRPIMPAPCRQSLLLHNPHRVYRERKEWDPQYVVERGSWTKWMLKWAADIELRAGLRFVDRLYCQTDTMRQRCSEVLRFPVERIGLCPNAFSPSVSRTQTHAPEMMKFDGRFVLLCVARYYPHKNLEIVVETFRRYRETLADVVCVLTIDASHGAAAAALIRRIAREGLQENVVVVGEVPQERLGEFYVAADAVLLPTLLESFSGTFLEAMYFEKPILASDRDFSREVCGDAALYVDPLSPESVRDGILAMKCDSELRRRLVANGRQRLQVYHRSWPDILRHVLEQECVATGSSGSP
jgi:glycosyltransferase involved in cell wall biosynthesis